jgi:hypothetical protein
MVKVRLMPYSPACVEQPEEMLRGQARDLVRRDAAGRGQHLGRFDDIRRLVAPAAMRQGRQIRRVGLDQHALGRQLRGDIAQGL